jgi:FAD/FMN-containing dehydrogenase
MDGIRSHLPFRLLICGLLILIGPAPSAAALVNATLASCLSAISGRPELSLPGFQNYALVAHGMLIPRLQRPAAVIFPDTVPQVQAAVLCAVKHNVYPIPRSGGGSFEALSTADGALVIDLTNMAAVAVNVPSMTATVQTGSRIGKVYTDVFNAGSAVGRNLSCLGGVWPQVGFGGLMAAGGYGSMSRMYGVLADHVVAAKVVDAKGRLLEASPTVNPDLFFAIRGGGGGTYGIVVEATIKLIDVPVVAVGLMKYSGLEHGVAVLDR